MASKKYPPYWKDDRPKSEIEITDILACKLSEINHARMKPQVQFTHQNRLFILIGGVPSIPNQFVGLKFPGKVIRYYPPFFNENQRQKQYSQTQIQQKLFKVSMDNTSQEIKQLIDQNGFEQAIIVYHSFGGSLTAWFCSKYPEKVTGLICLGGTPVRFYPIMRDYAKAYMTIPDISREFIIDNYEMVYGLYDEKTKNQSKWTRFKSKEELLSFTLHNDPHTLHTLFDKIRALPLPILMVYGNNDAVLTRSSCSQSMIYMCYLHKDTNKKSPKLQEMKKRFCEFQGFEEPNSFNLQEKFVYFIEGGHGVHAVEKNNAKIQQLIDQYLYVLLGGKPKNSQQNGISNTRKDPKAKL